MTRHVPILLLITGLLRWLVASRTVIPSHDAGAYLWMAERVAEGDLAGAFSTVFHPLYPVLVGGLLAIVPLDPVLAGQWVACGLATLAVWPLYALSTRLCNSRVGFYTGLFYAFGIWLARHPADCLSEGPFFFLVALSLWALVRSQALDTQNQDSDKYLGNVVFAGVVSALAYATRPEGAGIVLVAVPWLFLRRRPFAAWILGLSFAVVAITLPIGWMIYADGFVLSPKSSFNLVEGVGGKSWSHYPVQFVRMVGTSFEAIGYLTLPLAVYGLTRRSLTWRSRRSLLLAVFLLQCMVIPMLRSNIRFLAGYGILLLPFSALGFVHLTDRLRRTAWTPVLLLVVLSPDLVRFPAVRREDRIVLRDLGEFLRARCEPGDLIATDEARLAYFSGMPPIPPRKMTRAELFDICAVARFAVVIPKRTGIILQDLEPLGLVLLQLPSGLAESAAARSLKVYERRR